MEHLPSPDERVWLVEGLAQLIAQRGADTFLRAPIVEPTEAFFPDAWQPDEAGVRALCRRLLRYAGLDLDVALEVYDTPEDKLVDARGNTVTRHAGAAAWFAGIHGKRASFGVDRRQLDEPAAVVGTMCHEIAHAYRHAHGIVERDRDVEERLTDLTTVYVGFGVLTTNNAYRYRSTARHYSHAHTGYLSPQAMAFLLALQTAARNLDDPAHAAIAKRLETNQAAFFRAARRYIRLSPEALALLELPAPRDDDEVELAGAPLVLHNLGKPVRAVPSALDVRPIAIGAGLGMAIAATAALIAGVYLGPAMAGGAAIGAIAGTLGARRDRRVVCNACDTPLRATVGTCPRCGGRLGA